MILKNASKKTVLASDLKEIKTILDKSFGLLRRSNPRSLFFRTRFGIHTFFLKKPIDVVILNNEYKVVKIHQSLKPNLIFIWNPLFNLVLELPQGTIAKSKTTLGDTLVILGRTQSGSVEDDSRIRILDKKPE